MNNTNTHINFRLLAALLGLFVFTAAAPQAGLTERIFQQLKNEIIHLKNTADGDAAAPQKINDAATAAACNISPGCIGGDVFEDFNFDGLQDTHEPPAQGIEVRLYDCNGAEVGNTVSDAAGEWSVCGLTDGESYRAEFTLPADIAAWAVPTHVNAAGNQSDVQFLTAPACTAFSISNDLNYCEENPAYFTTCYVPLDPINGTNATEPMGAAAPFNTNSSNKSSLFLKPPSNTTGSTYGVAWQPRSQSLFVSSYMKQTAGFGPDGNGGTTTGGIYRITQDGAGNPVVSLFTDLQNLGTGADPHPDPSDVCNSFKFGNSNNACWLHDIDAFGQTGKISLGDLELTPDGLHLMTVNLNDRTLIRLPLGNDPSNPTAGAPQEFDLSSLYNTCADATDWRPFGLGKKGGKMYLGAVCSAESTQNTADLTGLIYEFDPTNPTAFTLIFSFGLDYERNGEIRACNTACIAEWQPWSDVESELTFNLRTSGSGTKKADAIEPMPMLSDIEFFGDDLIIGVRDRAGDMFGDDAGSPFDLNSDRLYSQVAAGDILRAAKNADGSFSLENNGVTGIYTSAGSYPGTIAPGNLNTGPGGKEFYSDGNGTHSEIILGGLAQLPGSNIIQTSTTNPFTGVFSSGGVAGYDNMTGTLLTGNVFYDGDDDFDFGKNSGLGDLELMCGAAPLEIGNYIWCDSVQNGVQDACERGMRGIKVSLYDDTGLLVGTTESSAAGQYYFNQNNIDRNGVNADGSPTVGYTGLDYGATYHLVFGEGQYAAGEFDNGSETFGIATADAGNNDNIDSDVDANNLTAGSLGARPDGLPFITLTTSQTGRGDHKYDLGVLCACTAPTLTPLTDESICEGENFNSANVTTSVTNGVSVSYQWYNAAGIDNPGTNALSGQNTATLTALPTAAGAYTYRVEAVSTENNNCLAEAFVNLDIAPNPTATVTATAVTCTGDDSDENGMLTAADFTAGERFDFTAGATYTGTATYAAGATDIPAGGVLADDLLNPATSGQNYTVRFFNAAGCFRDRTVNLPYTECFRPRDFPDYTPIFNPCPTQPCHFTGSEIYLGSGVSSEMSPNGNTTADSDNDDGAAIGIFTDLAPGGGLRIPVTAFNNTGNPGFLRAWVDWNSDGDFDDSGEQIADVNVPSMMNAQLIHLPTTVPVSVPQNQPLALRLRISTDAAGSGSPCGGADCAADGEVEDYLLRVDCPPEVCVPAETAVGN